MSVYADLTRAGPLLAMEAALTERLQLAFPSRVFEHATVPARVTAAGWARLLRRTPFVGLGWGGFKIAPQSGRRIVAEAAWTVFLVNKNEAAPKLRLVGDSLGVGQLGMAQVAAIALHGLAIRDVGTVIVGDAQNLFAEAWDDQAGAMTGLNLTVAFELVPLPGEGSIDEFLRHVAEWRIEPGDVPAATDTIALREGA
jgi:phage gp37-like protein